MLDVRAGGVNDTTFRLPGATKWANITLKRGVTKADEFYKWMPMIRTDLAERHDVFIRLHDERHKPVMTWKVKSAVLLKIAGPPLIKASGSDVAIEEIELAHEGFETDRE